MSESFGENAFEPQLRPPRVIEARLAHATLAGGQALECREALAASIPATSTQEDVVLLLVCPVADGRDGSRLSGCLPSPDREGDDPPQASGARTERPDLPRLTPTEKEVIRRIAQGKTNRAIAQEMYVSVNTIKSHIRAIFQKLGVHSRSSAARYAVMAKLVD